MQGVNQEAEQTDSSILKDPTSQTAAIAVGISLPRNILGKIDADRGDVSRSRFLLRIIERVYSSSHQEEKALSLNDCNEIQEAANQDV
jgi:hypothetical protein